jgi:hypothetical protein
VEVSVDIGSLARERSGNISGIIFLTDGARSFPEAGWYDFPITILGWWLEALGELSRSGQTASCRFMDGPFQFRISVGSDSTWLIEFLERDDAQTAWSKPVNAGAFVSSLRGAGRTLVAACQQRGWDSPDVQALARRSLGKLGGA